MKDTLESALVIIGFIIVAEVINEAVGYRCIDVKFDKNTIRRRK